DDQHGRGGQEDRERAIPQLDAGITGHTSAAEALADHEVGMQLVVGVELAGSRKHLDDGTRPSMRVVATGQRGDYRTAVRTHVANLRLRGEHEGARGRGSGDRDRVWGAGR